jgi:hypothetical protein
MARVAVPEAELAQLGEGPALRAALSDELHINELFAFGERAARSCEGWAALPPAGRERFLAQRPQVLKEGDTLALAPLRSSLAVLRAAHQQAVAAWKRERERLATLALHL